MSAGAFDPTFGNGGRVAADFSTFLGHPAFTSATGQAMAVQRDGKIVVAGTATTTDYKEYFGVDRLNTDGSYDTSFGTSGKQSLSFSNLLGSSTEWVSAVAVDAAGRIVVAGTSFVASGGTDMVLARLTPAGRLDTSFGLNGRQYFTFSDLLGGKGDYANGLAFDTQGRILVVGSASNRAGKEFIAVARLNTNGWFDPSFGIRGRQYFTYSDLLGGTRAEGNAVAVDPQGCVVIAGFADTVNGGEDTVVARLTDSGHFDTSFGLGGRQYLIYSDLLGGDTSEGRALALDPRGNILVAGYGTTSSNTSDFTVARLNSSGWCDSSFGLSGRQYFDYSDLLSENSAVASSVVVDSQGNIVVAGTVGTRTNGTISIVTDCSMAVTRLTDGGWFDGGFGIGGRQYWNYGDMGASSVEADAAAVDGQGCVVVAGTAGSNAGNFIAVSRLDGGANFGTPSSSAAAASQAAINSLVDAGVSAVVKAEFVRDGELTRKDMLDAFTQVLRDGSVSVAELHDLNTLGGNAGPLNMPGYVRDLTGKTLNALNARPVAGTLRNAVNKYFRGLVHPVSQFVRQTVTGPVTVGGNYSAVSGKLFGRSGPVYTDIFQGNLGDCTVMASLAEVTYHNVGLIEDMFIDNGDGTWTVRFLHGSQPEYVTVDNQLPGGGAVFDRVTNNILWAALVEKAYVQMNEEGWLATNPTSMEGVNSYAALDNGNFSTVVSALAAFSGQGSTVNSAISSSDLAAALDAGQFVVLGTPNSCSRSDLEHNHAYAVLSYTYDANGYHFTLFNPWGINGGIDGGTGAFMPGFVAVDDTDMDNSNFGYSVATGAVAGRPAAVDTLFSGRDLLWQDVLVEEHHHEDPTPAPGSQAEHRAFGHESADQLFAEADLVFATKQEPFGHRSDV
jgi:uncharacterized delta-60 repeat protein